MVPLTNAVVPSARRRRLQELARASGRVYGAPVTLHTRDEFAEHVTRASHDVPVVAALVRERLPHSDLLDEALIRLAARKKHVKFVRIHANVCIPGYPVRPLVRCACAGGVWRTNGPTGQCGSVRVRAGLGRAGQQRANAARVQGWPARPSVRDAQRAGWLAHDPGRYRLAGSPADDVGSTNDPHARCGWKYTDIEWELAQLGVCTTDLEENPHLTEEGRTFVNIVRK